MAGDLPLIPLTSGTRQIHVDASFILVQVTVSTRQLPPSTTQLQMRLSFALAAAVASLLLGPTAIVAGPVAKGPPTSSNVVKTPLGTVQGSSAGTGGGSRFAVRYGVVEKRWADSRIVPSWSRT